MSVINLENVHTFYSPAKVVFGNGTARFAYYLEIVAF